MKKEFRKKVLDLRNNQDINSVDHNSKLIIQNLLNMDEVKKAKTIMAYLDFNNEVKTDILIDTLIYLDKKVLIPITILKEKKLIPSQIKNLDSELKIGTYGIREPKEEFVRPVDNKEIDLVIVPGVAYDNDGYRLGYGGGFYDRFLQTLRDDVTTVGVAFDLQIFDNIPKESHDAQLDYIITETKVLKISK
ncbi:MAG TPA: 5-formyltetrahydrofolate cyclo-ligase [Peptostreptococcaceae bacterium]|nr:5-formyltetrahydrofolate cyclo-ligase [Peptostreptococcaceae bacterium]